MHSTGILGERDIFGGQAEQDISELGDRIHNLIDQVWWTVQKNHQKPDQELS